MSALEDEFRRAMFATYDEAKKLGYNANYFLQMLGDKPAVEVAKQLLSTRDIQAGLMRLWELGHLEISMEATVLQDRFASLFTPTEIEEARRRLNELGYFGK